MYFVIIAIIIILIFIYNNIFDTHKFIEDTAPLFYNLIEKDYKFYLNVRYGEITDKDVKVLFERRIRDGFIAGIVVIFLAIAAEKLNFIAVILAVVIGFVVFKSSYTKVKSYYKTRLHSINLMLPYYLKGLEILVQHYTVPVALARSINSAPDVFKPGLRKLVARIEEGDMTIQPYIDFANEYPVRDSMRMMRLLYRLSLGSQAEKHEQIIMFSRTVSNLQHKAREQKYKERLEKMEKKTMVMLFTTGGGILMLMLLSMTFLLQI